MTAPQITALQAPIDGHRQAQMHCLANIYVGRAPLGWRAKLEIDALPLASPPSLPAPPHMHPSLGGLPEQFWGCASQSLVMEEQQVWLV